MLSIQMFDYTNYQHILSVNKKYFLLNVSDSEVRNSTRKSTLLLLIIIIIIIINNNLFSKLHTAVLETERWS